MRIFLFLCLSGLVSSCVLRKKDILYQPASSGQPEQRLDVYAPKKMNKPKPVLIFIHGGNWNSGKKSTYRFLGNSFARKGIVTLIIDYPLSPQATYQQMAEASARAVQWAVQNATTYGGDPKRVFVSGHSAGGHLAALIALDSAYFSTLSLSNPLAGVILIDAAGLDMYSYLMEKKYQRGHTYLATFGTDPATWKKASPRYHLNPDQPPFLIYRGEKTYESIEVSTEAFMEDFRKQVPSPDYFICKGKKHIPMITQFIFPWNPLYHQMIDFMDNPSAFSSIDSH
ncbi:alpha/beta hydrolase [Arundinibacter roseus]|uniref:Alpha/beta hydrolase n=1 Tax=Arundinibacter roseus TaxID=2070510 RepID=A0A4R4JYD7_9BACT|nr:alpha/beta hydrolase [Arundinibacter roseus]TDB59838.1 alpha/beta hydrolase [Arundinibacter roseus]